MLLPPSTNENQPSTSNAPLPPSSQLKMAAEGITEYANNVQQNVPTGGGKPKKRTPYFIFADNKRGEAKLEAVRVAKGDDGQGVVDNSSVGKLRPFQAPYFKQREGRGRRAGS